MFPLPLVPFEEYMLVDDRPTHPMSFFLQLQFKGKCDRKRLDESLQGALGRHPLLAAKTGELRRGRFTWIDPVGDTAYVNWNSPTVPRIDLCSDSGVRVIGNSQSGETQLQFQFHHACCDGVGALQFIEDVLHGYARSMDLRRLDDRTLAGRGKFGMTRWKLLGMARKQAVGLRGIGQFLMRTPVPVKPATKQQIMAALPMTFPSAFSDSLTPDETKRLVAAAKLRQTTLNNVLICDLFLALAKFRADREIGDPQEWLRLSIPVNLRGPQDAQLPAANVVSMVFLDRRPAEFGDVDRLLQSVHDEMQLIKDLQLGLTFPLSLSFSKRIPGSTSRWRRISKQDKCRATCVLSNLMRPFADSSLPRRDGTIVVGNLALERIDFLPPIRAYTAAAFGVLTYRDELRITLHFDSRVMEKSEANELLACYVHGLRRTLDCLEVS